MCELCKKLGAKINELERKKMGMLHHLMTEPRPARFGSLSSEQYGLLVTKHCTKYHTWIGIISVNVQGLLKSFAERQHSEQEIEHMCMETIRNTEEVIASMYEVV